MSEISKALRAIAQDRSQAFSFTVNPETSVVKNTDGEIVGKGAEGFGMAARRDDNLTPHISQESQTPAEIRAREFRAALLQLRDE